MCRRSHCGGRAGAYLSAANTTNGAFAMLEMKIMTIVFAVFGAAPLLYVVAHHSI
jgi:hypothetical protein